MATGSVTFVASQIEEPPMPGARLPKEYVTASFSASGASVASASYAFGASFSQTPSVWGGVPNTDQDASIGTVYAASMNSNSFTFVVESDDGTDSSFTGKTTFVFSE